MISQAADQQLKDLFQQHLNQTRQQIQRLDQVWSILGIQPQQVSCDGMKGILTEGKKNMQEAQSDTLRDGLMAGGADKVEHYEISSYTGLILAAKLMGQNQVAGLLQQNLDEERWMAQQLSQSAPKLAEKALQAEGYQASGGAAGQPFTTP
jgi:ferritin-like metal-binding protein YciE